MLGGHGRKVPLRDIGASDLMLPRSLGPKTVPTSFVVDVRAVGHANGEVYRMKPRLKVVQRDTENRAVAPTRLANSKYRSREHLTPNEVKKLIEAAKTNRYRHRDATMLLPDVLEVWTLH
jgi:hypothetical protein